MPSAPNLVTVGSSGDYTRSIKRGTLLGTAALSVTQIEEASQRSNQFGQKKNSAAASRNNFRVGSHDGGGDLLSQRSLV